MSLLLTSFIAPLLASAPVSLGGDARWAAFRVAPQTCEARGRAWRVLPESQRERQPMMRFVFRGGSAPYVHVNLRRLVPEGSVVQLVVDDTPFVLDAGGRDAFSSDADAARIIAALRRATKMRVTGRDRAGRRFSDYYPLDGVPAAIDAAAAGCAR